MSFIFYIDNGNRGDPISISNNEIYLKALQKILFILNWGHSIISSGIGYKFNNIQEFHHRIFVCSHSKV